MSAQIIDTLWAAANSGLTGNDVRAVILCDTASDLPGINDFTDITLVQGSVAHVIDDDANKMLNSSGTWQPYTQFLPGYM